MSGVTVRTGRRTDLTRVCDLWVEMMRFHADRDDYFATSSDGPGTFREYLSEHMDGVGMRLLIAEKEGEIVGYCLALIERRPPVFDDSEHGSISDLAVTSLARREGAGRMLVAAAEDWFRSRSLTWMEARIATRNEVSQPFWRKMGFDPYMVTSRRRIE